MTTKKFILNGQMWNVNINPIPYLHISKGNTKVKNTLIFSLPPIRSCPGAPEQCKKTCYSLKFYRVNHRVRTAWEENFIISRQNDFVYLISKEIQKRNKQYFRVNDAGDFYNQEYLNKWLEIANKFPNIKFLAYTKSYNLNFSEKPDNFIIRYSIFPDTENFLYEMPLALLDGCEEARKTYHCKLGSKCDPCRICWNSGIDVKFSPH